MQRGHAQIVRRAFGRSPTLWAGDGRHYVRSIESAQQAEAAALALQSPTDLAAFYLRHQAEFEGRRPEYRAFVVHDRDGSVDAALVVERDGFCWRPLGVTWTRGRKRPSKGLKAAVQALCTQEGICGVHPSRPTGSVNRSTLGRINCTGIANYSRRPRAVIRRTGKTRRPSTMMRRKMAAALFALPRAAMSSKSLGRLARGVPGAYPMDTMARARNARSRAISMMNAGYLSQKEAQVIFNRTAAHTAQMARRGAPGWNALERKTVQAPRTVRSIRPVRSSYAPIKAAANRRGAANCGCKPGRGRANCSCQRRR